MTRNINHIIGTAQNKVIPLGVADSPVESGINLTVKQRPVSLHKTRIVAPDSLNTARRQRPFDHQHPLFIYAARFAGDFIE
ncbi:Uncharacterised protein [Salmonella enterica subsp. enterica serovar Bovismorbificans]|uniref:Uncharacterized protein n=1 Tax=Salmonella enterica subsp. enterica serovar Bovismorbificans TaxID=58097 RepID=A0A655D8F4_SALET|nr:Uncharacterised protein [Salmonella enterica subsp. enterica serovar Bovismorbificans]